MTELKPCPFCGGEAVLCKDFRPDGNCHYDVAFVKCQSCGCATAAFITDGYYGVKTSVQDAINAWNRRPRDDEESFYPKVLHLLDDATIAQLDSFAKYAKQRAVIKRTEELQRDLERWRKEKEKEDG